MLMLEEGERTEDMERGDDVFAAWSSRDHHRRDDDDDDGDGDDDDDDDDDNNNEGSLSASAVRYQLGPLDLCVDDVVETLIDDILGFVKQARRRDSGLAVRQAYSEARKCKSFESFEIVARCITFLPASSLAGIMDAVVTRMLAPAAVSASSNRRGGGGGAFGIGGSATGVVGTAALRDSCSRVLTRLVQGLSKNPSVRPEALLLFVHRLVARNEPAVVELAARRERRFAMDDARAARRARAKERARDVAREAEEEARAAGGDEAAVAAAVKAALSNVRRGKGGGDKEKVDPIAARAEQARRKRQKKRERRDRLKASGKLKRGAAARTWWVASSFLPSFLPSFFPFLVRPLVNSVTFVAGSSPTRPSAPMLKPWLRET